MQVSLDPTAHVERPPLPRDGCTLANARSVTSAAPFAGFLGVLETAYSATNPFCNLDSDCPRGYWCNGYSAYVSTVAPVHAGQCTQTC